MLLNSYAINFYLILTLSVTICYPHCGCVYIVKAGYDIESDIFEFCNTIADSMNMCDYELNLISNFEEQSARFF